MTYLRRYSLIIAAFVLFGLFSAALPQSFPTAGTVQTVFSSQMTVLLLAVAITIPLRAGEFDLSIGSIMATSMIMAALLNVRYQTPLWLVLVIAVAFGIVCGLMNAVLVVGLKINGLIATLGTSAVLTGVGYALTNSEIISPVAGGLLKFATVNVLGLPAGVFYGWLVALLMWAVFEFMPVGRYWLFAGGNAEAAHLSGVHVIRVKFLAFIVSAVICSFAGVTLASLNGAADPSIGAQYLLPPFAAAFLGTAGIQLGRFNIIGTVAGIYVISVGSLGIALSGTPLWLTQVFSGAILIIAVGLSRIGGRQRRTDDVTATVTKPDGGEDGVTTGDGSVDSAARG